MAKVAWTSCPSFRLPAKKHGDTGYIGQGCWNFRHTDHFEASLQPYHIGKVTNSVHIMRVLEELYLALLQYLTMDSKAINQLYES